MNTVTRYILLVIGAIIVVHSLLTITHPTYSRAASESFTNLRLSLPQNLGGHRRANATFVILARNSDVNGMVQSIRDMEERFNREYGYPYVFLNEEEFSDDFKRRVQVLSSAPMEFGVIPKEHWYQPDWIDEKKAEEGRKQMTADNIIYGGSVAYRNMCRFNSGFFYKHPLLQKYRWYWRIEPDVHFHCDVKYDPFLYLQDRNKTYGWTITLYEHKKTVASLWGHVKDFMKLHPELIHPDNAMYWMSGDKGETYNYCHFWSNFEIADMDFWRSPAYSIFFDYLDKTGNFYYERWGDAPIHSIGVALLLPKDHLHFFGDMGYEHSPNTHCPRDDDVWKKGRCSCDNKNNNFDYKFWDSCMWNWDRINVH